MNCGHGATPAALVADANPGSTIAFSWRNGEGGPWVHNTGPVMTYMASCGDSGCANFSGPSAEFFKISELGQQPDGNWTMADLNAGPNATTSVTLPSDLPAGEYLVRHELIAMQLGMSPGGAEFYPACLQIRLAAPNGTAAPLPSGDQVVNFPGGYSDTDPGILDPDIYNPGANYTFPGPPLISSAVTTDPSPSDGPADPTTTLTPTSSEDNNPSSAAPTATNACGNPNRKKKRHVVKRIIRQGPLIKKRSEDKPLVKREAVPVPDAHRARANYPNNIVRSRVMRGVF
jgi:hypothetical protein